MIRESVEFVARALWRLSMVGVPHGEHIVRYSMYKSIQKKLADIDLGRQILSISHSTHLCQLLGIAPAEITEANYPEQDACRLSLPSDTYSAVISDQVLEHIACTPERAVDEVYRVLAPGGIAIHTTCFLTTYHGSLDRNDRANGDYWRFMASGFRFLHQKYSRIIAADGWGNPFMTLLGGVGVLRQPIPEASWHPLNRLARFNWGSNAFVVWVIARK